MLTVGMATYDDFYGVYSTIQAIMMYHKDVLDRLHFVIIDNNPDSIQGKETYAYSKIVPRCNYTAVRGYSSTAVRNLVFETAPTDYVMCIDSHVFLDTDVLKRLIRFYENNPDNHDLLQGPLLDEHLNVIATEMHPGFRDGNFGTWHLDKDLVNLQSDPKEIAGHGMGLFVCSRRGWPRFVSGMRLFGGEELIIHEKFRLSGRKAWCLPFLRWVHRFQRPGGATYANSGEAKATNMLLGFNEVSLPFDSVIEYYGKRTQPGFVQRMAESISKITPVCPRPAPGYVPFLGKQITIHD
jgi:hypothetical protein